MKAFRATPADTVAQKAPRTDSTAPWGVRRAFLGAEKDLARTASGSACGVKASKSKSSSSSSTAEPVALARSKLVH